MRYILTYFRNQTLNNGDMVRLEIYREYPDDWSGFVKVREIGDVLTGLHLDIEGGMDDIDTPIVKTSLTFSVVDAPERNNIGIKAGNWEEFYTTSATGWKVVLLGKKPNAAQFTPMWSGYVTPDSYTETLQYHGVVTITARDNIGHLQDFDFDAIGDGAGMITPLELLTQAWEKIGSPMRLGWFGEEQENEWPQTAGVDAEQTYINVAAFKDKTWYDAVSETLYAYGLAMRYTGNNLVSICPLRRLPLQGRAFYDYLPHVTPVFEAYATRELVPAVKDITEEVSYTLEDGIAIPIIEEAEFTGASGTCIVNAKNIFGEVSQKTIAVWPVNNEGDTGWGNIKSNTLFFKPQAYPNQLPQFTPIDECMFLAVNSNDRMVWYGQNISCQPMKLTLEYGPMIQITTSGGISRVLSGYEVKSIKGAIKLTTGGVEYYYDGNQFTTTYKALNLTFQEGVLEQHIAFHKLNGEQGLLQVFIFSIDVEWQLGYPTGNGAYLGLKPLNFAVTAALSLMQKNVVKTVYNEGNNVRMSRTPMLGPAYDKVAMAGMIPNGIFRKESGVYVPTPEWKWKDEEEADAVQLAVLIHKQLLCYHSKPNNVLTGDIVNADMLDPRVIWTWKGAEHMLLSGSYNFLSSRLEGATLREFMRYNQMWPLYRYLLTEDGQKIITEDGDYVQVGI